MPRSFKEREERILNLLISEHIASALPIGSKTISDRFGGKLSPATIRNILSDLEERGYLTHPHTSSGRVPTEKGFRYYVDSLLAMRSPSEEEIERIRCRFEGINPGLNALVAKTSTILSSLSHYASLVVVPRRGDAVFKHMEFLPLSRGRLLGIFVTRDGAVQNRIVEIGEDLTYLELEKINNYCNKVFYGLTLTSACKKATEELEETQSEYDKLMTRALLLSQQMLSENQENDLIIDGKNLLFDTPEFYDIKKVQQLLAVLEEKRILLNVLERTMEAGEIQIFIGSESNCCSVDFCSIVSAPYRRGGDVVGIVGVIGPKRMKYKEAISVVDCTSRLLSELLDSGV